MFVQILFLNMGYKGTEGLPSILPPFQLFFQGLSQCAPSHFRRMQLKQTYHVLCTCQSSLKGSRPKGNNADVNFHRNWNIWHLPSAKPITNFCTVTFRFLLCLHSQISASHSCLESTLLVQNKAYQASIFHIPDFHCRNHEHWVWLKSWPDPLFI